MNTRKTLVIGATERTDKYANIAVRMLRSKDIPVLALGIRPGIIDDVIIEVKRQIHKDVHTVTLYVGPEKLKDYYNYILELKPRRVIFNPGTEDEAFRKRLDTEGIETMNACTLVLLQTNQY